MLCLFVTSYSKLLRNRFQNLILIIIRLQHQVKSSKLSDYTNDLTDQKAYCTHHQGCSSRSRLPNYLYDKFSITKLFVVTSRLNHGTNVNATYQSPFAGAGLKGDSLGRQALTDWDQERTYYQDALPSLQSTLYSAPDGEFDDKTVAEYEKGFRYGTNKDKLDEALENAVLKSELYGDPAAVNQYRYYGGGAEEKRRRRRDARRTR